jgi:glycine betaine/proline transport system permease protein
MTSTATAPPTAPDADATGGAARPGGLPIRPVGVVAATLVAGVLVLALLSLVADLAPTTWRVPLGAWVDAADDWVVRNRSTHWLFVGVFGPITAIVDALLVEIEAWLDLLGWPGVVLVIGTIAGVLGGWRVALVAVASLVGIGAIGQWDAAMRTLALMSTAVALALLIGVPLGILAGRNRTVAAAVRPVLDAMQTTPVYVYLLPLVLLFRIGDPAAVVATVIYATPPAVRLTALGIQRVPDDLLEVGRSVGTTPGQLLRTVQLPSALPSIRVGINQTIMMALAMVVIGSLIGGTGLGLGVLNGLQNLDVGRALEPGVAIVLIAVLLDRITYRAGGTRPAWLHGWRKPGAVVLAFLVGLGLGASPVADEVPGAGVLSFADVANRALDTIQAAVIGVTRAFSDLLIVYALEPLRLGLLLIPWWLLILAVAALAWRLVGAGLAAFSVVALAVTSLVGLWPQAMNTMSQLLVAVVLAVAIGLPLGIAAGLSDPVETGLRPVLDTLQTMPAFVYLIPVVALFQVGRVPGVIATVVYALPPLVRLTSAGIRGVPASMVEAARSCGCTTVQLLRSVQLPNARPQIMLGVNQTTMMALASIVIAGLIGASGLGLETVRGLTRGEIGRGIEAGLVVVLLGIVLDRVTQSFGSDDEATRARVKTA